MITRPSALHVLGFALLLLFGPDRTARADFVSSYAAINLLDPQLGSSSNDPNTFVETSASAQGASAFSHADTNVHLGGSSVQPGIGLVYNAGTDSGYGSSFTVSGNPTNALLPLSFNFTLTGNLAASSLPNGGVAVAGVNYNAETSAGRFRGSAGITSQFGIPTTSITGSFPQGNVGATITPRVQAGTQLAELLPEDFQALGILPPVEANYTFESMQTDQFSGVAAQLAAAIFNLGLERLNLLPGVDVEVGVDVEFTFDSAFSVQLPYSSGIDILLVDLATSATASPNARASSNYATTLSLASITVPRDFTEVDVDDLQVVFGSGLSLPVTHAIPEPSSFCLLAMAGLLLATFHWRSFAGN